MSIAPKKQKVTIQTVLDAAKKSALPLIGAQEIKELHDAGVFNPKNKLKTIEVSNRFVFALPGTAVRAGENAVVIALDGSVVEAGKGSVVRARAGSIVIVQKDSKVFADGSSTMIVAVGAQFWKSHYAEVVNVESLEGHTMFFEDRLANLKQ